MDMRTINYKQFGRTILSITGPVGPDAGRQMLKCLGPVLVDRHREVEEEYINNEIKDYHKLHWHQPWVDGQGYWAH